MKESVRYKFECLQRCTAFHPLATAKRHKEVPVKRLKMQIDEFISEDDWLWQEAISIDYKLDEVITSIQKLKKEMMQKVYEKKLAYALQWDTADNIVNSIKVARDGNFDQLTCANIFRINQKLQKGRKIDDKEVKKLTKEIIHDTKLGLSAIVQRCFQGEGGREKKRYERETIEEDREARNEEDEILRYAKGKQPKKVQSTATTKKVEIEFGNSLPTVKINKIQQIGTSFNIIVKILRIVKQFMIGRVKKVEFIAGDETGIATVVVDQGRSIRRNNVISISRARIFLFHGIKQIQNTDKGENVSIVKELDMEMEVDQDGFNLSEKRRERDYTRPYREDRPERTEKPRRVRKESDDEEEPQNVRTNRGVRTRQVDTEERKPREERPRNEPTRQTRIDQRRDRHDSDEEQPEKVEQSKQDMYSNKKNSQFSVESSKFNRHKKDQSSQEQKPAIKKKDSQKTAPIIAATFQSTKISNISPGDEKLNLIAEILEIRKQGILGIKQDTSYVHCIIGDDTGISRIQLPKNLPAVKEGAVLKLTSVNADVDIDHRITLKLDEKEGLCERTGMRFTKVNKEFNLSLEVWESEQEEDEEPIIEDF